MKYNFRVTLQASRAGSIGTKYNITREYDIEAETKEAAEDKARELAYGEGLEHAGKIRTRILQY